VGLGEGLLSMITPRTVAVTPDAHALERVSALDLMQLSSDAGAVPNQVGAVLVLDAGRGFDPEMAVALLGERIERVPRLRQRLTHVPVGCGRPIWVDDPLFDLARHVTVVAAPVDGDAAAVLAIAATRVTIPLPMSRPLWSATFVTGLAADRVALVVVFHHVLADGLGGLAVLAHLLDAPADESSPRRGFPQPPPTRRQLRADGWRARLAALRRLPTAMQGVQGAVRELDVARTRPAPRTSLNRPTGPHRRLATVHTDLASIRDRAHAHGATVNDVVLTAVTGALRRLLLSRGERIDEVVVSVLVAPSTAGGAGPGNRIGVMPVRLPIGGRPEERLRAVATATRARKHGTRGASATLIAPLFRLLAALGLLRWFIDHQRMVTTFVTNLAGPRDPVTFAGHTVVDMQPVSLATGNVTVAFAVLSYAGTLTMTVAADPDHVGDLDVLVAALHEELRHLSRSTERQDSTGATAS
jgi:diacylglycerol O-acyltransferase / wax synthase